MILKNERVESTPWRDPAPFTLEPFFCPPGEEKPHRFYRRDKALSDAVIGYRKGERNPYVEELMRL